MRNPALGAAAAVAFVLAVTPVPAAGAESGGAAPSATEAGPGSLPTAAQIERATDRFLEGRDAQPSAPRAATGGVGSTASPTGAVLPQARVVSLYGAPQMGQTILGLTSPKAAAKKLAAQSEPFAELGEREVVGAFDLVSVFATAGGGPDNLYRTRQDPDVIRIYLDQARAVGARLVLDIQPGRAKLLDEIRVLQPFLRQPDVDLAIDPEWNVGRRGVPGQTEGKVTAKQVNKVIRKVSRLVRSNELPPKLLLVHQFRKGSVRGRGKIKNRAGVQTVLNFDGIGSPSAKAAGYASLSMPDLFNGFSLFYRRDTPLMTPRAILGLDPDPDFLLYQ